MSATAVREKEKATPAMTIQVIRNKAEQALVEHFQSAEGKLAGNAAVLRARKAAIASFAATGLPSRRVEEWKYTDLRNMLKDAAKPSITPGPKVTGAAINAALGTLAGHDAIRLVFIDGHFDKSHSTVKGLPAGIGVRTLSEILNSSECGFSDLLAAQADRGAVAALNAAFVTDGAAVHVADGTVLEKPVVLVFARASGAAVASTVRNEVRFGKNARGTLVEMHVSLSGSAPASQVNTLTSMSIGDGAAVTHVKCEAANGEGVHLSTLIAELGKNASYRPFQMTTGGALTRNDIAVTYAGQGGKLDLSGVFLARGSTHIDTTLAVDHAVPHCESRELFKGVLDGTARGIFQGKIIVRPGAQKTDGKQMAQALMLSPDAEFDSKPELEIYADDVVCGHGSTAAELDEDLLFYCLSRGIPLAEARALLIESFIGEALARVEDTIVREALTERANAWLRSLAV